VTARENEIKLRLNDDEMARLDEIKPRGMTRAVYMRSLLREPKGEDEVASRPEALAILTAMARDGKVSARRASWTPRPVTTAWRGGRCSQP
jgi:hypothetical protein